MAAKTTEEITADLKKLLDHIAEDSKRADKHWDNIADSIKKSTHEMTHGWPGALTSITGTHKVIRNVAGVLADSLTGGKSHLDGMEKTYAAIYDHYKKMEDPTKSPSRQKKAVKEVYEQLKAASDELKLHRALHEEIAKIVSSKAGPAFAALAGAMALGYQYSHLINQELIQASADWKTRTRLANEIANVQAETGNEMKDMAKAAAALVKYGFDLRNNFKDTLSVVVKMEEGLGVSYETSAEMAIMMQRIGTNLRSVADGIARVKADTALSAEEATKFATEIARAINLLKPGSGNMADQVIEYVNRLGGALREVGGNASDIKDMLISFTQQKGMMGAATLGATPDFLSSPERAREVTKRFVDYVNSQLKGTAGYQRMATIQLLSEQFGTTADLIANADKMLERYNTTVGHTTDLQNEWRMQTSELGKSMSKIFESFRGVIQQIFIPVFQIMRPALAVIADWVQAFTKSVYGLVTAGGLVVGVTGLFIYELARLSKQMYGAILATEIYKDSLKGGGGVAGPLVKTVSAWLPRMGFVLTRVLPVLGALTAGIALGTAINAHNTLGIAEWTKKAFMSQEALRLEHRNQTLSLRGNNSYAAIMGGVTGLIQRNASAKEIQNYLLKNASALMAAIPGGSDPESVKRMATGLLGSVGNIITTQRAAVKYSGLTAQSEEDKRRQEVLIELFKAVAINTELQNQLMERATKKNELNQERDRSDRDTFNRLHGLDDAMMSSPAVMYRMR